MRCSPLLVGLQVDANGELAVRVQWNSKSKRHVLDVPFADRKLRMGTEAQDPSKAKAGASSPAGGNVEEKDAGGRSGAQGRSPVVPQLIGVGAAQRATQEGPFNASGMQR